MIRMTVHGSLIAAGICSLLFSDIWSDHWLHGGLLPAAAFAFGIYLMTMLALFFYRRRVSGTEERSAYILSESVSEKETAPAQDKAQPPA